ncbi:MAG: hypothetical protein OXG62_16785 [Nitrospinae bacterium]|nr:hypothetical protein [Nitrospinota bacterium]
MFRKIFARFGFLSASRSLFIQDTSIKTNIYGAFSIPEKKRKNSSFFFDKAISNHYISPALKAKKTTSCNHGSRLALASGSGAFPEQRQSFPDGFLAHIQEFPG